MDIIQKQNLYTQYLTSVQDAIDTWFIVKSLHSKLAKAHDAMCQKFFDKPVLKKFHRTVRYCIIKQYKPVMSDVFLMLNKDFPMGQEFSRDLFYEKTICEYYTPNKMCVVNGCDYHSFNRQYFSLLQDFQNALEKYEQIILHRDKLYNEILSSKGRTRDKQKGM